MRIEFNRVRLKIGSVCLLFLLGLPGYSVFAGESTIHYPVKRIVTGEIMSVSPPFEKGRDGEINVSEKSYRITSRTVLVDAKEKKTDLSYFKAGQSVYMVVDLFADHREALFISPK